MDIREEKQEGGGGEEQSLGVVGNTIRPPVVRCNGGIIGVSNLLSYNPSFSIDALVASINFLSNRIEIQSGKLDAILKLVRAQNGRRGKGAEARFVDNFKAD